MKIHLSTPEEEKAALDEFFASQREGKQAASDAAKALDDAAPTLIDACRQYDTGGGRRIRDIVWSLYGCSHNVNLGDACSGLDGKLAKAAGAAIQARLFFGPDCEDRLRDILEKSGEMARWNDAEKETPPGQVVAYPPPALSPEQMRRLADSVEATDALRDKAERMPGKRLDRHDESGCGRGR